MHSSEHNRAVALARWARVRERERAAFGGHEVAVAKAALCGFLAGDGNIKRRLAPEGFYRYYINCFPDDDEMLAAYLRFFYEVYAKAPRVTPMQGYFAVKCSHQSIGEDILKFAQFGIHTWSIPNFRTSIEKIAWL